MSKIRLSRPQSTPGAALYGSLRRHSSYVSLTILAGNCGDHHPAMGGNGDDTGFKSAHDSRLMRWEGIYGKSYNGRSEFLGSKLVEAPELTDKDRDGELIEVNMSHEQFAELLTSTGHSIDCTISSMRPVGTPGSRYVEEVKDPPDIADRMRRRVEKTHEKALAEIDAQVKAVDDWKASEKVKDSARHALAMVRQHLTSNIPFAVTQAVEEMSVHVEAATSIIGDKVASLEAAGRLPVGSTERFLKGDGVLALPGGAP